MENKIKNSQQTKSSSIAHLKVGENRNNVEANAENKTADSLRGKVICPNCEEDISYYVEKGRMQVKDEKYWSFQNGFKEGKLQTISEVEKLIDSKEFLEHLADLEHDQWISWTIYFLENYNQENTDRWYAQCETPYPELSEKEKVSDRRWAKIIIEELKSKLKEMKE